MYHCVIMHAGVPQPVNVTGIATNTSVTLRWALPEYAEQGDSYFNVRFPSITHT